VVSNSSLSVSFTGVGLIENGTEAPLPSWLKVAPVNSSFMITADTHYFFQVCVSINTSAPQGTFTIVLNESVNGQPFLDEFELMITEGGGVRASLNSSTIRCTR
jgi:hypothetical protein